ncbi:hypothetical protein MJO28_007337, partial [Puccinia striiformis f. sp. tritici]
EDGWQIRHTHLSPGVEYSAEEFRRSSFSNGNMLENLLNLMRKLKKKNFLINARLQVFEPPARPRLNENLLECADFETTPSSLYRVQRFSFVSTVYMKASRFAFVQCAPKSSALRKSGNCSGSSTVSFSLRKLHAKSTIHESCCCPYSSAVLGRHL